MSKQARRYQKKNRFNWNRHQWNQQRHTRKRFKQHFGIKLSQTEYFQLVGQIQECRSLYVETITKHIKNHIVEHDKVLYLVGYDKRTKQIATVLPEDRLFQAVRERGWMLLECAA
jgi:hypothetical protein